MKPVTAENVVVLKDQSLPNADRGGNGVWANVPAMFQRDFASAAGHEIGHGLYREHAPDGGTGDSAPSEHDASASTGNICLMSYAQPVVTTAPNQGDFCGVCLLALRGGRIA